MTCTLPAFELELDASFFLLFLLFRATPAAYGGSQAKGRIGTAAIATQDQSLVCDLHHSSRQCLILNPLREARDGTHDLMVPSWIRFPLHHNGNAHHSFGRGRQRPLPRARGHCPGDEQPLCSAIWLKEALESAHVGARSHRFSCLSVLHADCRKTSAQVLSNL